MGSASTARTTRALALSLTAVVGTLAFAASPVSANPGAVDSTTSARSTVAVQEPASGEAYTRFIVGFTKDAANATPRGRANAWGKAARDQGVSVKELRTLATGGTLIGADKPLSGQAAEDFMAGIAASGAVHSVEPDARMRAALTPDDTRYSEQWDFTAVNATGVAGVAPGAKVVPVRVLAKCGGSLSDIAEAIVWASGGTVAGIPANANPAKVINMSLGGSGACGTTYQTAIDSAVSRGTTVVVAAGNSNQDASGFRPANCGNGVSVAASNPSGTLSYYSNYGGA
ncbi:S8 family serine peptidase [Arthrobacter sp. ISL-5]|uniref:S8 family serine peptidase n=1 Tax=Arthrobacter sp. ISL-5 TaxID=2819111 RepID=UPI0020360C68|nr:S8 family serine peptidase [Arthrobacter sp. ISL-5]